MAYKVSKSPTPQHEEQQQQQQPNYRSMSKHVFTMSPGEQTGELERLRGVAFREETKEIFVADEKNSRIQIFHIEGHFIHEFGEEDLEMPSGLLIQEGYLFVTDWGWLSHSIFKYELNSLKLKKKIGINCFDPDKGYNLLRQPCTGPNGHIYIPDNNNNRLCIFTLVLERIKVIKLNEVTSPVDIKFSNDQMYVLSNTDKYCIHVCTLSGDRIESLVTRGEFRERMQVQFSNYFLIDPTNNIVISDFNSHDVKVFDASGTALLYKVGGRGDGEGGLVYPMGIVLTKAGQLIVASENRGYGVQVFETIMY